MFILKINSFYFFPLQKFRKSSNKVNELRKILSRNHKELYEFVRLVVEICWLIAIDKDEMTLVWSMSDFDEENKRRGVNTSIAGENVFKYFDRSADIKGGHYAWRPALIRWTQGSECTVESMGSCNMGQGNQAATSKPGTEKHEVKELNTSSIVADIESGQTKQAKPGNECTVEDNKTDKSTDTKTKSDIDKSADAKTKGAEEKRADAKAKGDKDKCSDAKKKATKTKVMMPIQKATKT